MLKKYFKFFVILVTLFYFDFVYAYEYQNKVNEAKVRDMISQIRDAREQYEDLVGGFKEEVIEIYEASSNSYWWPIGSSATTTIDGKTFARGEPETMIITSYFGYRPDPFGRGTRFHSGMDISGGSGLGNVNIIAARDGVVVYPTAESTISCPSNTGLSNCGGGYGNYVIIQHSDGNYTLYGHLHSDTITVRAGESVRQGQVIGKMGSSGNSTGAHLHFEVREGSNAYNSTVDPLNYISSENPRANVFASNSKLIEFIHSWEGTPPQEGDYYIAFDDGYGNLTIGWGVVPKYNKQRFSDLGIDVSNIKLGDKVAKNIVDQVENQEIQSDYDKVNNMLANAGITLEPHQVDALVSRCYNYNVSGFAEAYKLYGNTEQLYDNYMSTPIKSNGKVSKGLVRRRNAEWAMFHYGEYQNNS